MGYVGAAGPGKFAAGSYVPSRSLDFEASSSQSLTRNGLGSYNRAKWAWQGWIKRESTGEMAIFSHYAVGIDALHIGFDSSNRLSYYVSEDGFLQAGTLLTTATYTDTSAFHHILIHYDSANATSGDRMRIWFDGVEVTVFTTDTAPTAAIYSSSATVRVGFRSGAQYFDGLIYQSAFFSGYLPGIAEVYNAGLPKSVIAISGLWSVLDVEGEQVTHDGVLGASAWTNNNTVSASTTIPT